MKNEEYQSKIKIQKSKIKNRKSKIKNQKSKIENQKSKMDYLEITCMLAKNNDTPDLSEIVIALLSELGFDSFEETDDAVKAYTPDDDFDVERLLELIRERPELITSVDTQLIKHENWNQLWEANFPIADIAERLVVYAPFHADVPQREHKLCIMPQMSFGTGHHETTALMLELMLDLDVAGKKVIDMGCGTGILAIFAAKKNAAQVMAIDIDEWACRNAAENCQLNNTNDIEILHGDGKLLQGRSFDVVIANITRNILLADMAIYANCLTTNGMLQISGFLTSDFDDIVAQAEKNSLNLVKSLQKKNWMAALFQKR